MQPRILGFDFIRVCAILMILSANSIYLLQIDESIITQLASFVGFLGLEIFFILSGFLLTLKLYPLYLNPQFRSSDIFRFIKRRLIEILPLYYLILTANIFLAYFMDYSVEGIWKYFFFIQNFSKSIPAFFPESWGLPIILFAALGFPLLLIGLSEVKAQLRSKVFLLLIILILFIFLWTKWIYNESTSNTDILQWDVSLKTVAVFRFDSVFIGVLAGWFYYNFSGFWNKFRWIFAIVAISGTAFLTFGVGYFGLLIETHQAFWNIFYLPLTSVVLCCYLPILSNFGMTNSAFDTFITFISKASFAIYLLHFSIILLLTEHLFLSLFPTGFKLIFLSVIYFIFCLVAGSFLYAATSALRKRNSILI